MSLVSKAPSQISFNQSWQLNNQRFNPDLFTSGKVMNIILIVGTVLSSIFIMLIYRISEVDVASLRMNYTGFFGNLIMCTFNPFILCICNKRSSRRNRNKERPRRMPKKRARYESASEDEDESEESEESEDTSEASEQSEELPRKRAASHR